MAVVKRCLVLVVLLVLPAACGSKGESCVGPGCGPGEEISLAPQDLRSQDGLGSSDHFVPDLGADHAPGELPGSPADLLDGLETPELPVADLHDATLDDTTDGSNLPDAPADEASPLEDLSESDSPDSGGDATAPDGACLPDCFGKNCGGDGCGGSCGSCPDDANPCTDSVCDGGLCTHVANAAPCNDGNACTAGDHCSGGNCSGALLNCDDALDCTDDWCDPAEGCIHVDNGQPCWPVEPKHVFVDVVVVGAGTGGSAAAIEAARLGMEVALLEETDWVGGQMTAAAVTSMDEAYTNRDSGIYKEFIDHIKAHYSALGKSISTCYWSNSTWCFEPWVGRQVLTSMMAAESSLDLYLRARLTGVTHKLQGGKTVVTGVEADVVENGEVQPYIFHAQTVIEATEYGDVLYYGPAAWRMGKGTSSAPQPSACIQDCTYTAVLRKYSGAVPASLKLPGPPPGYNGTLEDHFESIVTNTGHHWLTGPNDYPADWLTHVGYRGMPDSSQPGSYQSSQPQFISRSGVNWANDHPLTAASLDPDVRMEHFCAAKLRTLQFLWYVQSVLGQSQWAVANDEGFDTAFQTEENLCPGIPAQLKTIEKHFPVIPYVREGRRLIGMKTLTAGEIKRVPPCDGCPARAQVTFDSALAVGDYPVDLHNCNANGDLELQLESTADVPAGFKGGPFQVPFEVFVPASVDGLLAAEKNLSVTRLVNGAIRLQPITMLTGQAAGAIAALAIERNVAPRNLHPAIVQDHLVDQGCRLSAQGFTDVPRSHPRWKDIQFVAGRKLMNGMSETLFAPDEPLTRAQAAVVVVRTFDVPMGNPPATPTFQDMPASHWAYAFVEALVAAGLTSGCNTNPPLFCPDDPLNRAAMAKFLVDGLGYDPGQAPQTPYYSDMPKSHWAFPWIQWATSLGIMEACAPGLFCPDASIPRGTLAATLRKVVLKMVDG